MSACGPGCVKTRTPRPISQQLNRGFDAAKLVKGRKRHIITDTGGLLVGARVHAADIQDRDGAPALLA
ncbi:MAG: transposase, partial [Phycisphaerae bacterium]